MTKVMPGGVSLYDQNPQAWDNLAASGYVNLAAMAKLFSIASFMDRQLGTKNAVSKWQREVSVPRWRQEYTAGEWLAANPNATIDMHERRRRSQRKSSKARATKDMTATANVLAEAGVRDQASGQTKVFIFVCDEAVAPKLLKIAGLLNCAVEEL